MASSNMYRVGDFVYFESTASAPYQIRQIEELNKTSTGAVEAKVICFYRRRDLSANLISLADNNQKNGLANSGEIFCDDILHQLKHRELFTSRHLETLPATHIRGKCAVTLHTETEPCSSYLIKEDAFFFQLVYDPVQKTLQADRLSIRIGDQYQATVLPSAAASKKYDSISKETREELMWKPHPDVSNAEIESFVIFARSLATLGRAYHPPAALRQPSLVMSAAAASRDTTHQQAMNVLHEANYEIIPALQLLAPSGQPLLKLDEMEEWSASEGNLFEEALDKYGKCFSDIQSDFLPWKLPKSLVEFYYMWKTTDHYVQQRRMKAAESEHRLKQVYIPNYNKPNPAVLYPPGSVGVATNSPSRCEGCQTISSNQWYALGPATCLLKVCTGCWNYWKRYGDLKASSILRGDTASTSSASGTATPVTTIPAAGAATVAIEVSSGTSLIAGSGSVPETGSTVSGVSGAGVSNSATGGGSSGTVTKSRSVSFYLNAPPALRLARRLVSRLSAGRLTARRPCRQLAAAGVGLPGLQREAAALLSKLTSRQAARLLRHCLQAKTIDSGEPVCTENTITLGDGIGRPKRPPRSLGQPNTGTARLLALFDALATSGRLQCSAGALAPRSTANASTTNEDLAEQRRIVTPADVASLLAVPEIRPEPPKRLAFPIDATAMGKLERTIMADSGATPEVNGYDSASGSSRKRPAPDIDDARNNDSKRHATESIDMLKSKASVDSPDGATPQTGNGEAEEVATVIASTYDKSQQAQSAAPLSVGHHVSRTAPSSGQAPKRHVAAVSSGGETETQLFLASNAVKRKRRKLLTPVELRHLSRRPWLERHPADNTKNGSVSTSVIISANSAKENVVKKLMAATVGGDQSNNDLVCNGRSVSAHSPTDGSAIDGGDSKIGSQTKLEGKKVAA